MKKVFAVLMALTLVLSMGIIAFADDTEKITWTGDITLESADNVSVDGKTFNAYSILNAEAVDKDDLDAGVIYSIPEAMQSFYDTLCGGTDGKATVDEVTAYINSGVDLQDFAKDALAAAKRNGNITPVTATGSADKAVFSNIPFGYYVIEDTSAATTVPVSALMLIASSKTVTIKADKPSIDKAINGDKDADKVTVGMVDYNTATVGEKVPYVLTSKVPDMTGYETYTYTVTDTFSKGLTYDDNVNVTIEGVADPEYTATFENNVLTITFNDFIDLADKAGAAITITYSATVNENAVIGVAGNPNTVNLTYSNNPHEDTTSTTPDDVVYTYLVDLIINKTDDKNTPLKGAEFAVKLGDATIATGTSDENGLVKFTWTNGTALKNGETYTITETKAPEGYNEAEDITFTVTCTYPEATAENADCTWTADNTVTFSEENNRFETTVINRTGSLLPETGGIGTTIFYVVGGLLMVAALVVLVSKKRMASVA